VSISKTELFSKNGIAGGSGNELISRPEIINAAFSEDVLKGNNSSLIELGDDRSLVLRMTEHQPAEVKTLKDVKSLIVAKILNDKARKVAADKAEKIKVAVVAGKSLTELAAQYNLKIQNLSDISRSNGDVPWQVNQAIFKAPKPIDGKPVVVLVKDASGAQTVINVLSVSEGVMTESDKARGKLAESNLANAFGQADFNAALNSLRENTDLAFKKTE
jgi:peptidyl-prolyl cis-trans isomerase D